MAALNTQAEGFKTVPDWRVEAAAGSISYHCTMAPGPPRTACWSQTAPAWLDGVGCRGSTPDIACVSLPSCVSSRRTLPLWTAFVGQRKPVTATREAEDSCGAPPDSVTVKTPRSVPRYEPPEGSKP